MNNQPRKFPPPHLIGGNSSTRPQQQPQQPNPINMNQLRSQQTNVIPSQSHPQVPDPLAVLLAQQAIFMHPQAYAQYLQVALAQQLLQPHILAQAQAMVQSYNANAIANAIANSANASANPIGNPNAVANANTIAIAIANANGIGIGIGIGRFNANANAIANVNDNANVNAIATGNANAVATGNANAIATGNANAIATGNTNAIATGNTNAIATRNANAISTGNANAIATSNADAIATGNANANAIAIGNANANASAIGNANPSADVVPSSSAGRSKKASKKSNSQRKKDSNLPEKQPVQEKKFVGLLPDSFLYTKLLDHDAEIDAALEKKKIEVQECIVNRPSVQKILRVYVFNTFANQTKPDFLHDKKSGTEEEPSWSLYIKGMIVEENGDEDQSTNLKFSNFFKRICIYLDENLYPDNHVIVWDSAHLIAPNDGLMVKRKGDKEFTAKIKAEINFTPEKFILKKPLSEILGLEFETHSRIVAAFRGYVHSKKLIVPNDPWLFTCDPPLKRVFGIQEEEKIMNFKDAVEKLSDHLTRPEPLQFEHKIKLSGDCSEGMFCYDIQVDVPFKLDNKMAALMDLKENWVTKGVEDYDKQISSSFEELNEHMRRRALLLSFSQDPEGFINASIDSQCKGMNQNKNDDGASGSGNHSAVKEIHSDEFYKQPWAEDAVIRYLEQKSASADDSNANQNRRNPSREARGKGKGAKK